MSSYSFQGDRRVWTPRDEEETRTIPLNPIPKSDMQVANGCLDSLYLDNNTEKWNVTQLMRLLRLYGAHSCLWNVYDPENRDRKLRKAALIDITAAIGNGVHRRQVLRKINVLRATYRYEKRRIKQRIQQGLGARTKLKWFALADSFLRKVPRLDNSKRKKNFEESSDLEDTIVFNVDPETIIPINDEEEYNYEGIDDPVTVEIIEESGYWENSLENGNLKQPWTVENSFQFLNYLKSFPELWNDNVNCSEEQFNNAIISISEKMCMPCDRIKKRIKIFKCTYEKESSKMLQFKNYKPNFIWWEEAENFMKSGNQSKMRLEHMQIDNFVDTNCVEEEITTPIKMPEESNDELEINPISSVPPGSVASATINEQLEEIYFNSVQSFDDAVSKSINETVPNLCKEDSSGLDHKLIWNGLEDDLLEGKWSLKHSVKFLRLYGAHQCLWNHKDPDFRSRELRNAAIEDIAAAMGHGLNAKYVSKKIKIFRITYMQQRKRMLEAKKRGEEAEIQLRWFPLADSFLRPHIGLRSIKENENEMPQFDYQYVVANLNLIDPALLTDFNGKGTQNAITIGDSKIPDISNE